MTEIAEQARGRVRLGLQESAKRALDVLLSVTALVLTAPLLILLCCLVRWTSPGPALFRQQRSGRSRQPFTMLKLRTMTVGNDDQIHRDYVTSLLLDEQPEAAGGSGLFKLAYDPRVTRLGCWLRRTSLDELPQLLNVLKGEMSIVGPRPALPWEAEMFSTPHQRRFEVRPGLTGLWQVSGRSKLSMREALDLDAEYVRRRNLLLDLSIILRTVPALFRGGAA